MVQIFASFLSRIAVFYAIIWLFGKKTLFSLSMRCQRRQSEAVTERWLLKIYKKLGEMKKKLYLCRL